jgi:hypothetical protein
LSPRIVSLKIETNSSAERRTKAPGTAYLIEPVHLTTGTDPEAMEAGNNRKGNRLSII